MIIVKNYIKNAFSANDAQSLEEIIKPLLEKKEKIILDFEGIEIFTTLFFNNALARYFVQVGPDVYNALFEIKNLSELGEVTYKHSIDNAKEYYKLNNEERKTRDTLLSDYE